MRTKMRVAGMTQQTPIAGEVPAAMGSSPTTASDPAANDTETAIQVQVAIAIRALRERQQRLHALLDAAEREQQTRERQLEMILVNNALGHPAVEALNRAGPYVRALETELADARVYIARLEREWAAAHEYIPMLERALREARVRIIALEEGDLTADSQNAEEQSDAAHPTR